MKIYYQEPNITLYQGHALEVLKELPDESVDCVMTSPPYWGLRTYKTEPIIWGNGHCEHEWITDEFKQHAGRGDCQSSKKYSDQEPVPDMILKRDFCLKCHAWKGELGLEPTIELYIEHLMLIFTEVKRVLKKAGTCWVNIDDSYSGSGGTGNQFGQIEKGIGIVRPVQNNPAKSLCLIPERFCLAMVNSGWILRNRIAWFKPNPMPESVKDRFTTCWEYVYFFTKSRKYWFEQQFEKADYDGLPERKLYDAKWGLENDQQAFKVMNGSRNKRDHWEITTEPYPDAHFATYPEKLCETPILSGCPSMICSKCGKIREKLYKKGFTDHNGDTQTQYPIGSSANRLALLRQASRENGSEYFNNTQFLGYSDCGCNAGFYPGTVLDPFGGSGTTGAVAKKLARKFIQIELNPQYCKLSEDRISKIPIPMELNI